MNKKPKKTPLSVSYVVKKKEQVDELKAMFNVFLTRCEILDLGNGDTELPVILSQSMDTKSMGVNLDPSCQVVIKSFDGIKRVHYNIGEIALEFDDGQLIKVRIGVMGPEDD